jgi:hypothetical protein
MELILGHGGLGEDSIYDYSKLKRKGRERERKASYSKINTRCGCASGLIDTPSPSNRSED